VHNYRLGRPPLPACLLLFVVLMGLSVSSMTACNQNQRNDTIHASLLTVNAARDGYVSWDLDQQKAIIAAAASRDNAVAAIAKYRETRQATLNRFELAYRLLAVAATQTDSLSLSAALSQAGDLVDAISTLLGKPRPANAPPGGP
jgi:hypothetical protein